jgi:hypothetical protein
LPSEGEGHTFESCRVRHFGAELGTPKAAVFAPEAATSVRRRTGGPALACAGVHLPGQWNDATTDAEPVQHRDSRRQRVARGLADVKAESSTQIRKLRMGWDVRGLHCDRNKNSRDALVLLEATNDGLEALEKWRRNLRDVLVALTGTPLICEMLALRGLRQAGPLDLTIAIDTPLGWPQAMLCLANGGQPTHVPQDDDMNPYTRRATEVNLVQRGYRPLSTVRDMLGSQSTKGIHFLQAAATVALLPPTALYALASSGVPAEFVEGVMRSVEEGILHELRHMDKAYSELPP